MASGHTGGTRPAGAADSRGSTDAVAGAATPSPKVRKILRLEARARRLLARYERALAQATRAMGQARARFDDAHGLECSLTGTQLGELHRGRAETAGAGTAPGSTPPAPPSTTTTSP